MNNLVFRDNVLLMRDNLLIDCCCDNTATSLYYEAIPCDAVLGVAPAECCSGIACAMIDNKYIDYLSYCDGTLRYICECQLLKIDDYNLVEFDQINNLVSFSIKDSNYPSGSVVLTDDAFNFTLYPTGGGSPTGIAINFTGYYRSVNSVFSDLTTNGDLWSGAILPAYQDTSSVYGLQPSSFLINYGQTKYFNGKSRYKISLDNSVSDWFYLSSGNIDPVISGCQAFSSIGSGNITGYLLDDEFFTHLTPRWHLYFNGSGICGQEFSALTEYKNGTIYKGGGGPEADLHQLNFIDGYKQDTVDTANDYLDHRLLGAGTYTSSGMCPFGQGTDGVLIRDDGFRCCPQKGCVVGPDQFIGPTGGTVYNLDDLSLLETTFYYNGRCYQASPYFYTYGLLGRFAPTMVEPDVTITGSVLPTNSAARMMIVSFNQALPWGGFGGYCADMTTRVGPCSDSATSYRPLGTIKTEGEWLTSKYLWIKFKYFEPIPFSTECDSGTYASDLLAAYGAGAAARHDPSYPAIQRVAGLIDVSTLPSAFTIIDSGAGNNWYYELRYNLSGKTVKNLVDDLNTIQTLTTHTGGTQTVGCPVFAACYGLPEIASTPAALLNNASSDLFELGLKCNYTNAAYMPFEDGANKISADVLLPIPYADTFPTVVTEGTSSNLPVITPPDLYTSVPALIPPKNRILSSLPNRGCNEIGFDNGPSQWYYNLQLYSDITARIYKNSIPSYYNSLTVNMISGLLTVSATSGSTVFSGTINTNKNGSGYRIVDFVNACTGLSINDGSNIFNPITAVSGTQPFDIWLDDATWASGTNQAYPMYPFATNAVKTTINYAYREPFIDYTGNVELLNGQRFDLSCLLRRRSWSLIPSTGAVTGYFITDLPDSISQSNNIGKIVNLDCDRDVVEDRSWIIAYGCLSPICKTRYYYEAEHCGCSQLWGVGAGDGGGGGGGGGDGNIGGLLAPGDCGFQANPYLDLVEYPTIYVCEDNIHPLYDKPILLKVPKQYILDTPDLNCPADYWQKYNTLDPSSVAVGYDDTGSASENGWCQFIRPGITNKVAYEDIDKRYPATAYINDRVCVPFYPSKPYTLTAFDTYESFDAYPVLPPEYINPDTGLPCNAPLPLNVYMRAAVAPFVGAEWDFNWQGFDACARIDVDCTTKCCGCFFLPTVSGADCCYNSGPYSCDCLQDITYESTEVKDETAICCSIESINNRCPSAGCQYPSAYSNTKWVADGKITITTQSEGTLTFHNGCCDCEGTIETSQTLNNSTTCNGTYDSNPDKLVYSCCETPPTPPSGYYNCPGGMTCSPNDTTITSCVDPSELDPVLTTASYATSGCYTNEGTCDNDLDGTPSDNPADIDNHKYVITQTDVYGVNVCGIGTNTRSSNTTTIYSGTAGPGDSPCFNGRTLGWYSANPNPFHDTLTTTLDLTITYGDIHCAACPYSIGSTPTYSQLNGIISNIQNELVCGITAY